MIDAETRTMFDEVRGKAQRQGTDLAEALDRSGLLLTARKKKLIQFGVLNNMVSELEQVHPTQLLRMEATANGQAQTESTPLAMYSACVMWLNAWIRRVS